MAKESLLARLFAVGALAAALMSAVPGHAAVGRTAGNYSVSNNGAFNYTIPIFTPPGPNGIQPTVALAYNSNAEPGFLGFGWTLAGDVNSSIKWCPSTLAQDGYVGGIGVCLDGNNLRKQSGSFNVAGSAYLTEIADSSRVTLNGTTTLYWVVERKNGLIYTYGGSTDSQLCGLSKLSEIRDRAGNKVRFTWKTADSTSYCATHPTKIEWTQTSSGSGTYVYSMDFIYSAGVNGANSSYRSKWPVSGFDNDLLTAIAVSTSGTVKRKYVLTYENSPTTVGKRLTQVKECSDSAATDCLAPTTITYQGDEIGVETSGTGLYGDGQYDFNGDGIKDLMVSGGVRFGSSSGFGSVVSASVGGTVVGAGKLTGAAADQWLSNVSGTWYVYSWNGSSFSAASTGITVAASSLDIVIADVNGDGRDDLVYSYGVSSYLTFYGRVDLTVRINTSTNGTPSFSSPITGSYFFGMDYPPNWSSTLPMGYSWDIPFITIVPTISKGGDSDGDGREELNVRLEWSWCFYDYYYYNACVESGGGTHSEDGVTWFDTGMNLQVSAPSWVLTSADFNADGCDDFLTSGGVGLSSCYTGVVASEATDDSGIGSYAGFADWNADGRMDYFVSDGTNLYVRPFVGDAMGTAVDTGINASFVARTDGHGDGLDDIIADGQVYYHKDTNVVPDLISEVVDGFGVTYTPTYSSISGAVHTPGTSASYPNRDLASGLRVVASVTATDGVGGTYDMDYHYTGARGNVYGRGFMGFAKIESEDSRTGIKRELQFEQEFPYIGMLKSEKFYQPAGSGGYLISSKTYTVSSTTLSSATYNERVLPYVLTIAEDAYEVGGSSNGQKVTSASTSLTHDSYGNVTASTRTVTDEDVNSPLWGHTWTTAATTSITPDITNWCLGLPASAAVTVSTTTGEASVTRSKGFTPDYVNCRMDEEYIEPSGGNLKVKIAYTYDTFGNVQDVDVTGRDLANTGDLDTRNTHTTWGTTGQFPVSVTNPLSQTTTRTFHSTFGSLLTEADPNSIVVTNNTYDSFGNPSRITRADGTSAYITRVYCAPYCKEADHDTGSASLNRLIVQYWERDIYDSTIRESEVYTDQFDRVIVDVSQTHSGGYNRIGHQYDAMGRVYRESAPCDYYSCSFYWTTNTYDPLGRITQQSHPRSASDSTAVITTFAYAGRTQTTTDPMSKVSAKVLDVNGWMRRSRDHDSYGQNFSYDAAGSLIGVTDTASNTLFSASYYYGARPFQYTTSDMDLGTWSYTYNSLGELVAWTDAKSQSFTQTYDALSRVLTRVDEDTGQDEGTTTWTWDASTDGGCGSYDIGKLFKVASLGYEEKYCYDDKGRPIKQTITTDQAYEFDYSYYTTTGLLDTLTYPTSTSSTRVAVKHCYDYGVLKSVRDSSSCSSGLVYWTADVKNWRGQTTQETLGNGVVTSRNFDAVTGWLNSIQSGASGGLQNQAYLYDDVGNVTQRQAYIGVTPLTESFYYDNLHRLDYSELSTGGAASMNLNLSYDAMGNIQTKWDSDSGVTKNYSYHSTKKHAVAAYGSVSYAYDANGNMTSRDGETITWASFNYPTNLSTATETTKFYYGPNRQYYRQDYTGPSVTETTYYIGGLLEKVCPSTSCASGTIDWRHYIVAEGQTVAIVSRKSSGSNPNTVSYPLEDNQGSGSTLTDGSGTLLVRRSYEAFGAQRDGDDWAGAEQSGDLTSMEGISRRGYTGHSMLGRMGLIHMNGRVQDSVTGRFLSPDPTIPHPGFTQSYNRYAYVNNNPLSYIDPSGFADLTNCGLQGQEACMDLGTDSVTGYRCGWLCLKRRDLENRCRIFCNERTFPTDTGLPLYPSLGPGGERIRRIITPETPTAVTDPTQVTPQSQTLGQRIKNWWNGSDSRYDENGLTASERLKTERLYALMTGSVVTGTETVTLYRSVSHAEYADIQASGQLRVGPGALEGKWFWESPEHAAQFGSRMEGEGNYRVIEGTFPRSTADQFMRLERLDNIGPARFGTMRQLGVPAIRLWIP